MPKKTTPTVYKVEKYVAQRYESMQRRRQDAPQLHTPDYRYAQPPSNRDNHAYRVPTTPNSRGVRTTPEIFRVARPTPPPEVTLDNATEQQLVEINKFAVELYLKQCLLGRYERNTRFTAEWVEMNTAVWSILLGEDQLPYLLVALRHLYSPVTPLHGTPVTGGNSDGYYCFVRL